MKIILALLLFSGILLFPGTCRATPQSLLKIKLTGRTTVQPGTPLVETLTLANSSNKPIRAVVKYSVQHDHALFNLTPPDPIYGSDLALGAKSWTVADSKVIDHGSLTDGKSWTAAGTDYIKDHFIEAFQYIDLGQPRRIIRMTWDSGDANWVAKVDVGGSMDGRTYTPVPSLQGVDQYKKWGTNAFPLDQPFEARYLRFRYHDNGVKATVIRMPAAVSVYAGTAGEPMEIPVVGRVAAAGTSAVDVSAGGSSDLPLAGHGTLTPGAYLVAVKVQASGRKYLSWQHVMVMPRPLKATANSRFGINGASADLTPEMQKLGVGWVRYENMKWPFVSNVKGVFQFDGTLAPTHLDEDAIVESYRAHRLNILPYLFLTQDYETPPGTSPPSAKLTMPPKDFSAYADFVYQTVARYGSTKHSPADLETPDKKSGLGFIHIYELWNEPNLNNPDWGSWKGPLSQYYQMFRLGAEAVKKADPTARVSNAGFSGIGIPLVDTLRTYKYADGKCPLDFMDVLNVHFYTGKSAPEVARINANTGTTGSEDTRTFEQNLLLLRLWRDRYKPGLPIWLTETGYDTSGPNGVDEYSQAAWLPRDVLLCLASGVQKVMVYRESGSDPVQWGSAGVLRTDGSAKPAFFTYATLIREMNGVVGGALRVATPNDNIRIYAWKRGNQPMLTAWTVEGTAAFPLKLGRATVADSFGDRRTAVDTAGLKLSVFPVYIRDFADIGALKTVLAQAARDELHRQESIRQAEALKVYLFGFGSKDDVGGFVIGDYRPSTPVLAVETYDDKKGYGFAPTAAMQDDDIWSDDPYNKHACRLGKGIQFRFRAAPGKYVLRVGVTPFDAQGQLTVLGAVGGTKAIEVTKENGIAQIDIQTAEGYADLRWLTLVQQRLAGK
jgi:hypothetical protein